MDPDGLPDAGQRQGPSLCFDSLALRARQPSPRGNGDVRVRASPGSDDVTLHEDGSRPDSRCPQLTTAAGVWDQQLAIRALQ